MGCIASGTTVCIMIPLDTIKTRLVTQYSAQAATMGVPYKGIIDCAVRMLREEGAKSFYKGLAPRLISVVPMIGIQFGVYEFMKKVMMYRTIEEPHRPPHVDGKSRDVKDIVEDPYGPLQSLEEAAMEVAASPEHPYPAPHFLQKITGIKNSNNNNTTTTKNKKKNTQDNIKKSNNNSINKGKHVKAIKENESSKRK